MSRLVGWAAILMTGTVLFGAGVVYTIGKAANEDARHKERRQVEALLDEQMVRLSELVTRAVEQQHSARERMEIFDNLSAYVDLAGIVETGHDGVHWVDIRRYTRAELDQALVVSQLFGENSQQGRGLGAA